MAKNATLWWLLIGGIATSFGLLAYRAARPASLGAGLLVAGFICALGVIAHRGSARNLWPVPDGEYLAAIWALGYVAVVGLTALDRTINVADSLFLYLPLGVVPFALRLALRDNGNPAGVARRAARLSHQVLGWLHLGMGSLFVVSLFYVLVSPLQLVPGVLHLWAGVQYRRDRDAALLQAEAAPPEA